MPAFSWGWHSRMGFLVCPHGRGFGIHRLANARKIHGDLRAAVGREADLQCCVVVRAEGDIVGLREVSLERVLPRKPLDRVEVSIAEIGRHSATVQLVVEILPKLRVDVCDERLIQRVHGTVSVKSDWRWKPPQNQLLPPATFCIATMRKSIAVLLP